MKKGVKKSLMIVGLASFFIGGSLYIGAFSAGTRIEEVEEEINSLKNTIEQVEDLSSVEYSNAVSEYELKVNELESLEKGRTVCRYVAGGFSIAGALSYIGVATYPAIEKRKREKQLKNASPCKFVILNEVGEVLASLEIDEIGGVTEEYIDRNGTLHIDDIFEIPSHGKPIKFDPNSEESTIFSYKLSPSDVEEINKSL